MTNLDMVVHIVDDEEAVRRSLAFMLMTSGYAVRVHDTCRTVLAECAGGGPACIVTDFYMPGMNGVQLIDALKSNGNTTPVVVMTGNCDVATAVQVMKAGAHDFLEKPFADDDLLKILDGLSGVETVGRSPSADAAHMALLTAREREVLDAIVAGLPNKVTGERLGISPRTVEIHRSNLMAKLGARSLAELVRLVVTR